MNYQNLLGRYQNNKFLKFISVGFISYPLTIGLTWLFTYLLNGRYVLSYSIVLFIMTIYNFVINKKFVFKNLGNLNNQFYAYLCSLIVFYFLNIILLDLLSSNFDIYYMFLITIVYSFTSCIKYFVYDRLIFN